MEDEIESNLVYLAKHLTNLESVLLHLIERKILSNDEREKVLSKDTSSNKNTTLLILLQRRNWSVIRIPFLQILKKTHNEHCAEKIEGSSPEDKPVTGSSWNYETNSILGYGSFGVVISVKDTLDHQIYALKIIPSPQLNPFSAENAKFLRESRNQAILHHPNVVKYISSDTFSLSTEKIKEIILWESEGVHLLGKTTIQTILKACFGEARYHGNRVDGLFIKTEICGETLRQWLNNHLENKRSPDTNICENISQGIVDGLNYIHSKSIIHRDLRPENIFFSSPIFTLPVKIGDFGLSYHIENYATQTMTLEVGNHLYRAPETIEEHKEGHAKYSHAIDLLSCGLTLSEVYDPAPAKRLPTKFITIVYMRDTGNLIKELASWLNELILKLTEREPTNRFNRDANGKPLPIEFLKVSPEKLPQKTISQSLEDSAQKNESKQWLNIQGEKNEVILPGDLSKVKEELRILVEEQNTSEIVRILSVTDIPKYLLEVSGDDIYLEFEEEMKKMHFSYCSLDLDAINGISTEELELWDVSCLRNGKELRDVNVNEFVDIRRIKKLTLQYPEKNNMTLDLSDESVSLEYLCLMEGKVVNWKKAKCTVKELRLVELNFTEYTQMKVKEMAISNSYLVNLSCLPQTLEKLVLWDIGEVRCTRRIEFPNLKYLELQWPSDNLPSNFSSVSLTHLHLYRSTGEFNVNFIPKSVTHMNIYGPPPPPIVGGVFKLEKLILNEYSFIEVKEYLTHFQPKELVVHYFPPCPSKELLELLKKGIQRIAVRNVDYDLILTKHIDRESNYYLFEGESGKAITKEEFDKLVNLYL